MGDVGLLATVAQLTSELGGCGPLSRVGGGGSRSVAVNNALRFGAAAVRVLGGAAWRRSVLLALVMLTGVQSTPISPQSTMRELRELAMMIVGSNGEARGYLPRVGVEGSQLPMAVG